MNEQNPLRIFTKEQLEGLYPGKLKRLKKEIMLEFQLTDQTTIVLNGMEIDKNGVLEIFEELESNLSVYLFIQEHSVLSTFLSGENLRLFTDAKLLDKIKNSAVRPQLLSKIVARLRELVTQHVEKPIRKTPSELGQIHSFIQHLDPTVEDDVYANSYEHVKNHLTYLEEKFESPFHSSSTDYFHKDLKENIDADYYRMLSSLPSGFNGLARQYGIWCNNIVYGATNRTTQLRKFRRNDLYTLRDAARIAANVHNREGNLSIAKAIQSFVDSNRTSSTGSGNSVDGNVHVYKDNQNFPLNFAGEKKQSINATLVRTKEYNSYSALTFNVDVMPSKTTYFNQLLPKSFVQKHLCLLIILRYLLRYQKPLPRGY